MARERSIVVRLKAEVADFQRQIGSASRTLTDFERAQTQMGGAATTTMGRLVQSAQINRQEWDTVGRSLAIVGGAVTALGGAALKVGIDYNSLRQSATQSLTAVTGSTEAAARQMKRLDDFGQNSWLMRDTLVRAQRQMTGFGIETEKVIPYMDGLAEAVAAAGGTNEDFEELARVMGKVQSTGKLTARELEQFGHRGIDAAEMIGVAMGKSADQIRGEITAGTLDAGVALDALAEGMKTTYDGATDLVRDTFAGAMDNAKAAFRDLMAEIAKPLVDPEGGGALVDWLNGLSDALRQLQEAPSWVHNAALALGGLTAAVTLGGAAFALGLPKYIEFRKAVETLSATHPMVGKIDGALGKLAKTAGRLGIAVGGAVAVTAGIKLLLDHLQGFEKVSRSTQEATNRLIGLGDATGAYDAVLGHLVGNVRLNTDEFGNFADAVAKAADPNLADRFFSFLRMDATGIRDVTEAFEDTGKALAEMARSDLPAAQKAFNVLWEEAGGTEQAASDLLDLMPDLKDELVAVANELGVTADDATLLKIATGELGAETDEAAEAQSEFKAALDEVNDQIGAQIDRLSALTDALRDSANAVLDSREAERRWLDALDDTREAIKENGKTLDISTEKGRANEEQIDKLVEVGWERIEALRETTSSEKELQDAMSEVRAEVIKAAEDMGMSGIEAERFADRLGLIPRDIHIDVEARTDAAERNISRLMERWSGRQITLYAKWVASGVGPPKGHPAGQADGSVRLRSFANGGYSSLPKHAVIQRATPGLIQWAEPETQGEAFIPLAPSKRRRSLAIWEETGRQLGALPRSFANGGFNLPPSAPVYSAATQVAGHTINVYGVETDSTSEVAKAVLFASRKHDRGGVHNRRS